MTTQHPEDPVIAEVSFVQTEGKPYAVAWPERDIVDGSVTFSLDPALAVWNEDEPPKPGLYVVLTRLRKSSQGWRAEEARYMRPEDEVL